VESWHHVCEVVEPVFLEHVVHNLRKRDKLKRYFANLSLHCALETVLRYRCTLYLL
jgi:hypothetical protein